MGPNLHKTVLESVVRDKYASIYMFVKLKHHLTFFSRSFVKTVELSDSENTNIQRLDT